MADVDPRQVQAQATLPPAGVIDDDGNIPTQGAAVGASLQTPAAAPAPQLNLVPPTPPVTATSPNKHLMSLGARILGALAGEEHQYNYSDAGKLVASSVPLTTTQKIGRIIGKLGSGLSAPTPEGGASSISANIGAGMKAAQEKTAGQDVLKRAQAKEDFEQQQQAKLRQHEIARQNALTLSTYYGAKKAANEMDPHFAQNQSLFDAVKASPELGAHATEMSDTQVEQEAAKDPTFATTHLLKPLGWAPETDPATGQQVMVDGEPKFYMRMAVVNGTKDGKIAITPEMAKDAATFGPMARIPNAGDLKVGDLYDLAQLIPVMNKIDEARKQVLDGWQKSEMGWVADPKNPGKEIPVETNKMMPPDMAGRTRPLAVKPMVMEAEEGKTTQEKAAAFKDIAEGKKALAEAALTASLVGNNGGAGIPAYMDAISKLPQTSQAILRNVSPAEQMSLLKVANGDAELNKVFPTRTTKGSGQLDASRAANLVSLLNPQWSMGLATTKQKALSDFSTGEDGKAIASFNQFLVHADDARIGSERLQRTNSQWLNEPINIIRSKGMGDPGVSGLMTDIMAARSEWQNFIKNGHASDVADTEQSRQIMSDASSPAVIMRALQEMGKQAVGRLDQIDAKWRRTWGGHYPGIVSDSGRTAATNLGLGDQIKMYPSESGAFGGVQAPAGSSQSGQPAGGSASQFPPGASHIVPGPDGKNHYTNEAGTKDFGVAP